MGAFASLPVLWASGLPGRIAGAAALAAPLGLWRARRVLAGDGSDRRRHEEVAFWAVALLVVSASLELVAVLFQSPGWPSPR
jgi:hypothetical protein